MQEEEEEEQADRQTNRSENITSFCRD